PAAKLACTDKVPGGSSTRYQSSMTLRWRRPAARAPRSSGVGLAGSCDTTGSASGSGAGGAEASYGPSRLMSPHSPMMEGPPGPSMISMRSGMATGPDAGSVTRNESARAQAGAAGTRAGAPAPLAARVQRPKGVHGPSGP